MTDLLRLHKRPARAGLHNIGTTLQFGLWSLVACFLGFCFRNTGLSRCIGFNLVTNTKTAGCRAAVQRPSPRGRGGPQLRQHHQDPGLHCQGHGAGAELAGVHRRRHVQLPRHLGQRDQQEVSRDILWIRASNKGFTITEKAPTRV